MSQVHSNVSQQSTDSQRHATSGLLLIDDFTMSETQLEQNLSMLSEIISAHRHGASARRPEASTHRPEASVATRHPEASASGSSPGSADQDGSERPKKKP